MFTEWVLLITATAWVVGVFFNLVGLLARSMDGYEKREYWGWMFKLSYYLYLWPYTVVLITYHVVRTLTWVPIRETIEAHKEIKQ